MRIFVDRESSLPVRDQLVAQLEFLIATRVLKPGDVLPSVRALARRLGVHHNTVSHAYRRLASMDFLIVRRGSRIVIRRPDESSQLPPPQDLDDLINELMRAARERGYTLQQMRQRVRERMFEAAPDHILVLSSDSGIRALLQVEIKEALHYVIDSGATEDVVANPGLAIGALVVCPPGYMPQVMSVLPRGRPAIPVIFSDAEEHLDKIRRLERPSIIAVASVSEHVLEIAAGLLEPVTGRRHSLIQCLFTASKTAIPAVADIVFCDSITYSVLRGRGKVSNAVLFRLIAPGCLRQISAAMGDGAPARAAVQANAC